MWGVVLYYVGLIAWGSVVCKDFCSDDFFFSGVAFPLFWWSDWRVVRSPSVGLERLRVHLLEFFMVFV